MLYQQHPGITEYGVKNYSAAELKDDLTFNPAGLISCQQSADVIFQQAIKEKKNGINSFTYGSMNRKELRNYIGKNVKRHEKKVLNFQEIGISVLHIDIGDSFEKNFRRINDFIQSFISDD